MTKLIICPKCNKEVPLSGFVPDDRKVKELFGAPLDCNGEPIADETADIVSKTSHGCRCYWCGAKLEAPRPESPAKKKKKGGNKGCLLFVLCIVVIYLCFKFIANSSDDSTSTGSDTEQVESYDGSGDIKVTDYSNEWAELEQRFEDLGTPMEYVQTNASKSPEEVKENAYKEYESIKDAAYELYQKIKDQHYDRYEKLKDAKYEEYERIKEAAYSKYDNDEMDFSEYNSIQSEAFSEYNSVSSKAFSTYNHEQSEAFQRYNTLQSDAYQWQSKVRSIANGL